MMITLLTIIPNNFIKIKNKLLINVLTNANIFYSQ